MAAETASKTAASIAAGVIKNLLGKKSKSYDSGGIADGDGFLPKATGRREMVLDPELTAKILEPESNERFQSFVQSMGLLFGTADRQGQSGGIRPAAVSSTDRHDVNYFINGVKVGSDMANRPLSEVLASLPIHTESY